MKKYLCFILALLIIFTSCPEVYAVNGSTYTDSDGIIYTEYNGAYTVTGYKGTSSTVIIPDIVNGKTVNAIGQNAFSTDVLTDIVISNSIIDIYKYLFSNCNNLMEINVGPDNPVYSSENGVLFNKAKTTLIKYPQGKSGSYVVPGCTTKIESWAFYNCIRLISINLPDGLTSIGNNAFMYCSSLTSINMPEGVTSIEPDTFYNCRSLLSIDIPQGVKSIGEFAFSACSSLLIVSGCDGLSSIGDYAFMYCPNMESIDISKGVTSIGEDSFYSCRSLKSISLYEGLTSIGSGAFYDCRSLTYINIPAGIKTIESFEFAYCTSLKGVDISPNVTSIGSRAFADCNNLTGIINLPAGVTNIGSYAFSGCSGLTGINIPDGVTSIGGSAFYGGSGLTGINIPDGVTGIATDTFGYCSSLVNINIPDSVTTIGDDAFESCTALAMVGGCNGLTSIGRYAFYQCNNLAEINIPDKVTNIGESAFSHCSSLTNINIPDGLAIISNYDFEYCTKLTNIIIPEGVTNIGKAAFYNCSSLTSINIPDKVTNIGESAFSGCAKLTNIKIPEGVTTIAAGLLNGCSSITDLTIPNGVTSIGSGAFGGCSFTNIVIPSGVAKIGSGAFSNCSKLAEIDIPAAVTSIEYNTFCGCSSLININIPNSVTSIGDYAFYGCSSLPEIYMPDSVTSLGNYAFYGCCSLTDIKIPAGVTSIGIWTFRNCTNLVNVEMTTGLKRINMCAFNNCGISSIKIPYTVDSIDPSAFEGCPLLKIIGYTGSSAEKYANSYSYIFESCGDINSFLFNVCFNSNGGNLIEGQSLHYNDLITEPVIPIKTGYTFLGWYKEAGCISAWNFTTDKVKSDTVLYAKWKINTYTVSFNTQGGNAIGNMIITYNCAIPAPQLPVKTGYTFAGWYKEADCVNVWDFTVDKVTADTTLYAKWTANSFNVTFNSNGGSAVLNQSVSYCNKAIKPQDPTKTGYTFGGWYTDNGLFSNLFDFTNTAITKDITLYARWISNISVLGVSLDINGTCMKTGDTMALTATVYPADAYNKKVTWSSSNSLVAAVDNTGKVTAAGKGTAIITVTTEDVGWTAACTVTVVSSEKPVISGAADKIIKVGDSFDEKAGITAADAEDGNLTSKISISAGVNVYTIGEYPITYTVTDSDGNKVSKSIIISVAVRNVQVISLIGSSRYDTAVKLSQSQFAASDTVIIVNGGAMADGLGATPLAAYMKAPLLLIETKSLPAVTINEIKRLKAKKAIIVGGIGVVSDNVKLQLLSLGLTAERISGSSRYGTSLAVAKYIDKNCYDVSRIVIANGYGEADALSIASAAGRDGMPIIIVERDNITTDVYNWLSSENIETAYIIGGTGIVSDNVLNKIDAITTANVRNNRLGGRNRFETNSLVIDRFYGSVIDKTYIAKGYVLIDALAAGSLAAINGAPVVLTGNDLSIDQESVLGKRYGNTIIRTGGGISDTAVNSLKNCLQ